MDMSGYVYICSAGETFDSIARAVYGDEKHASELLCANPEHTLTLVFTGEERLYLPTVTILQDADMSAISTAPWKE